MKGATHTKIDTATLLQEDSILDKYQVKSEHMLSSGPATHDLGGDLPSWGSATKLTSEIASTIALQQRSCLARCS